MDESGLKPSQIHSVEMVGDGTRIPVVQEIAIEVFEKEQAMRTINSAEAVSRGCSLLAAMMLPHFHVAKFEIEECNHLPVDISWSVPNQEMRSKTLFPLKNNFPSIKSMTFDHRLEPMDLAVGYTNADEIVPGIPVLLSRYKLEPKKPEHPKFALKLRVKLDANAIPGLDTAELIEEYEEEKKIPIKQAPPPVPAKAEKTDGEADAAAAEEPPNEETPPPPAPEQTFETKMV
jgi:heat shock protein 4